MFKPTLKLHRVTDITVDYLNNNSIKCLFLDVDNTLSTHHGQELVEGLENWIDTMTQNSITLILVSNSKKERVEPFAAKIGLPFISMGLKPLPTGFIKAKKLTGFSKKEIAAVGDQLFTDILGAKLYGIRCILLDLIKPEKQLQFRIKRKFEKLIFKLYKIGD